MTAVLFLNTTVPLMDKLFPPAPLAVQVQRTPTLIFGVLEFSLAIAFIALWRSAPDFRAFRMLGLFYSMVGFEQFLQYRGGDAVVWSLRSLAVVLLIETAAQAMNIPNHRWTWWFWPLYLFSAIALWLPGMSFVRDYPLLSQIPLAILVVQGFRRGARDRLIAGAFFVHFLVRNTLSPAVQKTFGIKNYIVIGEWQWQYTTITLTLLGGLTLAIFVRALIRDRDEKQRLAAELAAGRAVQQLLITESAPAVAGFQIESVYKPYGEVGGDFFPDCAVREWRIADCGWRCERQGDVGGDDGVVAGGGAARICRDHDESCGAAARVEPAHCGKDWWRLHHMPLRLCDTRRRDHGG